MDGLITKALEKLNAGFLPRLQEFFGKDTRLEITAPSAVEHYYYFNVWLPNPKFDPAQRWCYPKELVVAQFKFTQLPGCCGTLVVFHSYVYETYRGKGIGNLLMEIMVTVAREFGYSSVVGTNLCDEAQFKTASRQNAILKKYGWKPALKFVNSRTKKHITLSVLDLTKPLAFEQKEPIDVNLEKGNKAA